MADSIRERILKAAVTALQAAGKPAGLSVHRSRTRALTPANVPATVVYVGPEGDTVEEYAHDGTVERRLPVRLEHRIEGDPPDSLLDPLTTWATMQMMADPQWGGLAKTTQEIRTEFAAEETSDGTFGLAAHDFVVVYHAQRADPTTK